MPETIHRIRDKDGEELLFIRDFDGLAALVQLGTVEIHLWGATVEAVETPDQIIFDLDPDAGVPLERVREAALTVRDRLKEVGFDSLLKTSGGKGYHVVMPLEPRAGWDRVKGFARDFAQALAGSEPARFTATLSKKARKGKIFVDYLRNGRARPRSRGRRHPRRRRRQARRGDQAVAVRARARSARFRADVLRRGRRPPCRRGRRGTWHDHGDLPQGPLDLLGPWHPAIRHRA